jgi:hypothetical protein
LEKEIVVSYYNENINWLNNHKNYKITIYNKSDNEIENSIKLPNYIGADLHTHFYHIVNNYNNLADWTFFTQGNPFDHVIDYEILLQTYPDCFLNNKLKIGDECFFFSNGIDFNKTLISRSDGSPYHYPSEKLNINQLWENIFLTPPPLYYEFTKGVIFAISKKQIKIRNLEFYKKCLNICIENPKARWEMERIIPYIFNPNYPLIGKPNTKLTMV